MTGVRCPELKVDIVAVHGLNIFDIPDEQYARDTWRKDGDKTWLEQHLPEVTPQARIFLYEYRSTMAFSDNRVRFHDIANGLLEELQRRSNPDRPLIFLAHSLGGLLVEQVCRAIIGDPSKSCL